MQIIVAFNNNNICQKMLVCVWYNLLQQITDVSLVIPHSPAFFRLVCVLIASLYKKESMIDLSRLSVKWWKQSLK